MKAEGIYERQILDCNCNDCGFMVRSFQHRQKHEDNHFKWQKQHFDSIRLNLMRKADDHILKAKRGEITIEEAREKQKQILKEVKKMNFQFDKGGCSLSYGYCTLNGTNKELLKVVAFIPETLQLETQECFVHRKDTNQ